MRGKLSIGFLKVTAVVFSLAVGGGYVAWRQAEAAKANERERIEQAKADEEDLELIIGSKNPGDRVITRDQIDGIIQNRNDFNQPIPGIPSGSEGVSNVVPLLPGSKSISMPIFSDRDITKGLEIYDGSTVEVLPPPEADEKPPKLLPGSKSGALELIPVEPEKSE
jgi:hypothetical protein